MAQLAELRAELNAIAHFSKLIGETLSIKREVDAIRAAALNVKAKLAEVRSALACEIVRFC
jgi:hypothetical protein